MIELQDVSVRVGGFAIHHVSLTIPTSEYAVLMGRTGCGKTTILEAVCGLRTVTAGTIRLDNTDVTGLHPAERDCGYVPQDLALFPTMTVREHLAFAMRIRRSSPALIEERVAELSQLLGIEHLLSRKPQGLSGGEAQRVALGRALSFHPRVLLLDEPLSALDEDTRLSMYSLLRSVQKKTGVTALHVTHSRAEAEALGDRLFVVENGEVREERRTAR